MEKRILLIEDNDNVRFSLEEYLTDQGHEVIAAENGRIGLDLWQEKKPDIILTDLRMPELSGFEVIETVSSQDPDLPIITISGVGVINQAMEALRNGAWDFITKPILDLEMVDHIIGKCLQRQKLILENRLYQADLEEKVVQRTRDLTETSSQLKVLVDHSPILIFSLNEKKELNFTNRQEDWEHLWYESEGNLPQGNIYSSLGELDIAKVFATSNFYVFEHRDPSKRWWIIRLVRMLDAKGGFSQILGIALDITDRKSYEEKILVLNEELENRVMERTKELEDSISELRKTQTELLESQKQAALGSIVVGLAHELNTPIGNAITTASHISDLLGPDSSLLTEDNWEEAQKILGQAVDNLQIALGRTAGLVNTFKGITDTYSGADREEFALEDLMDVVLFDLKQKGIMTLDPATDFISGARVQSYQDALYKVFFHILNNAYIHGKGNEEKIVISITQKGENYVVSIQDHGPGFAVEGKEKYFDPFYTTLRSGGHLGLGLYVAQNLSHHVLQGSLKLEENKEGVLAVLTLPRGGEGAGE
jgi:C4-dicarboxylate-specific signal transduction histidine kinase